MTFIERLLILMKSNEISAYKLSKSIGISESLISKWQKNPHTDPSSSVLLRLSEFFQVQMEWLLTGEGEMRRDNGNVGSLDSQLLNDFVQLDGEEKALVLERIKTLLDIKAHKKKIPDRAVVPKAPTPAPPYESEEAVSSIEIRVYDQRASAGLGNYLYGESTYETLSVSSEAVPPKAGIGIRISGNSMEPDIPDNCIVWVEEMAEIQSGQIGIFVLNNEEAYCKRLKIEQNKRAVYLVSNNPEYKPIKLSENDFLRTIGKVVGRPYIF